MTANPKKKDYDFDIPGRDDIMSCLRKAGRPLTLRQLATAFNIQDSKVRRATGYRLRAMERDGQLIRNRRKGYGLVEKMDMVKGRVIGHPDGYGFVVPDQGGEDLFLPAREMRTVLNGDHVLVREVYANKRGKREGSLVKVLEHANHKLVGRYFEEDGVSCVIPDNKRISQDLLILPENKGGARPGQYVLAEIMHQPQKHRPPVGRILEIIGDDFEAGMAVDIAIRSYELPYEWPAELEQELEKLDETVACDENDNRRDLRHLPFVTIDGEEARDFDDAVYCEKQGRGWRLFVAIADVSHYVRPSSVLDEEARSRGTSVYFPERVIPMLPELLSNNLCSLKPDTDRFSLVCRLNIDAGGRVEEVSFFRAIIHSAARLTYGEMAALTVDRDASLRQQHPPLVAHLDNLYQLYQLLHSERKKKGLLDFLTLESQFEFDEKGRIKTIFQLERNEAHRLIEEMMLAANVAAGEFLQKHNIPCMYRVHDTPDPAKLTDIRALLSQLNLTLGGGDKPTASDYARLMKITRKRDDAQMLETILLRSMSLAIYSAVNEGHFGLGFPTYVHFTSPIRRYPDLMVHRAIAHIIEGGKAKTFACSKPMLMEMAEHCSMVERRAEDASRDAIQRLKCDFMKNRVGEFFSGMVSSVTPFGLFVVLEQFYIEGLIHVSTLPVDYYHYDPVTHSLRGERGGKTFRLGQKLKVLVAQVDLNERKIDFELIHE